MEEDHESKLEPTGLVKKHEDDEGDGPSGAKEMGSFPQRVESTTKSAMVETKEKNKNKIPERGIQVLTNKEYFKVLTLWRSQDFQFGPGAQKHKKKINLV